MSDMSVSSPPSSIPQQQPDVHEPSGFRTLSPLEPSSQQHHPYDTFARRGSITDPLLFRRPSITDMNNLPLPSAPSSRRGSMATTDYDFSSRSPSPSPFKPSLPSAERYDPYQRRHSIATAEVPHGGRLATSKPRGILTMMAEKDRDNGRSELWVCILCSCIPIPCHNPRGAWSVFRAIEPTPRTILDKW
ncbi:hypothetical protein BX666DRAFT_1934423 [Dichotomocladium elegans]|nr:hypothetical protein BX666DRAFT_1934423 [Dichotomocladium elegans]